MGTRTPANVDYKSTALPTELYVHIWRDNWSRTSILQNITADIFCTSYQLDQVPYYLTLLYALNINGVALKQWLIPEIQL